MSSARRRRYEHTLRSVGVPADDMNTPCVASASPPTMTTVPETR
ncbi:MAG: hypothetical protein ABDI19_03520 [Armatimonadota bacterium]